MRQRGRVLQQMLGTLQLTQIYSATIERTSLCYNLSCIDTTAFLSCSECASLYIHTYIRSPEVSCTDVIRSPSLSQKHIHNIIYCEGKHRQCE